MILHNWNDIQCECYLDMYVAILYCSDDSQYLKIDRIDLFLILYELFRFVNFSYFMSAGQMFMHEIDSYKQ